MVDIGGGTTEVAVISLSAIAYAESVRVAGDELNETIQRFIQDEFQVLIGENMGAFENPAFAQGSFTVAQILANNHVTSIVGGGDTDVVVQQARVFERMSFVSTGGGAALEFLEGKELPAFKALEACKSWPGREDCQGNCPRTREARQNH